MQKNTFLSIIFMLLCQVATVKSMHVDSIKTIYTSFKQGAKNNCVSVALIKTTMAQYGIYKVFREVVVKKDSTIIHLKNGKKIRIHKNDLENTKKQSGFIKLKSCELADTIYYMANFYFAVLVFNFCQEEKCNAKNALKKINGKGLDTETAFHYLGIPEGSITKLSRTENGETDPYFFKSAVVYVLYNNAHAAAACLDEYDEYGANILLNNFILEHAPHRKQSKNYWAYILK